MSHALPASFTGTSGPIRRGRGTFRVLAILSLFTMLCGGIALSPTGALAASTTTTTDDLNLRTGPGLNYDVILVMPSGSQVSITGDPQGGFYPVNFNGTDGFASGDFLAIGSNSGGGSNGGGGSPSATGTAWVIDGDLNLRAGPGIDASIITVMPGGSQVTLTGTLNNGYLSVTYQGTDGWAYAIYLSTSGSSDSGNSGGGDVSGGPTGTAWVIDGALNLRSGPSTDNSVLTVMPGGAQVTLTGQSSNGFYSLTYNGTDGWAYAAYLSQTAPSSGDTGSGSDSGGVTTSPTGTAWVIDGALNLRAQASTSSAVLTVMPDGAQVTLTGQASNGFLSVNFQGTDGWAWGDYLSTTQPSDNGGSTAGSGSNSDIVSIIYAAADKYGQPRADMLRVAQCESNLDPNAVNQSSGASGLFQFMPSTWASTPYANQSIFDATANANAAGWMWSVGRRNEWTCQ